MVLQFLESLAVIWWDWSKFDSTVEDPILIAGLQEFNHPLTGDQGARVVIHPPGSKPIPSAEGYNVPPGFSGSLGINIQRTLNLGEPYGKCSREDYRSDGNETYRLLPCLRRCIYEEVMLCYAVACPHLERSGMGTACSRSASAHLYHAGSRLLPCDGAAD